MQPFWYCTLSSHWTAFWSYCRWNPPCTTHVLSSYHKCDLHDITDFLLIPDIQWFYDGCSPSDMTHSLLTLSDCRCNPSGSAHFFYLHCRCEIPNNVDFLLQPHTLSSYSRCSFSDTVYLLLTLYCTTFSSHCKDFSWYQCHIPHTADFLLSPHTLFSTIDVPFLYCTLSPILNNLIFILQMRPSWYWTLSLLVLQMWHFWYCRFSRHTTHHVFLLQMYLFYSLYTFFSSCIAFSHTSDATLLVLHTFSIRTADVTLLILQIFSSNSTPCLPAENVAYWCCSLSSHTAQFYPHTGHPSPHTADATLMILHTFSPGTADVTFLILQNFSSHHATCFFTAHVTHLIL